MVRKTNGNVLILTPLAVSSQTVREGAKFGIEVHNARNGDIKKGINVVNYERLHHFKPEDFSGVVCDESSALKNADGKTRRAVTEFLKGIKYRLLCTATPAPNDHMELGTSSEALGVMSRNSMLGSFFQNDGDSTQQWTLKGHARRRFWQWCGTWARAVRKPSDLGFDDGPFVLPPLEVLKYSLPTGKKDGLFSWKARTLEEQRAEKRRTIKERCGKVLEVLPKKETCLVWCQLNDEGDLLEKEIPGAVQVAGKDPDMLKEERLEAFALGQIRVLVTKPRCAGWGLNYQHCSNESFFPSWSHEAFYQCIRRCWRFGQKKKVTCHLVYSEAESLVLEGMLRKERQSVELYDGICRSINQEIKHKDHEDGQVEMELPKWL